MDGTESKAVAEARGFLNSILAEEFAQEWQAARDLAMTATTPELELMFGILLGEYVTLRRIVDGFVGMVQDGRYPR